MIRRPAALAAALLLPVAALVGCGSSSSAGASSPSASAPPSASAASPSASPSNPYGAAPVDPPGPTDTVLSVTGPDGTKVDYTLASLEALGTTTITVAEPFVKQQRTFTGVPMATVLDKAGFTPTTKVLTVALNDYRYTNTAGAFEASQALIATGQDGGAVPYDQGGPIRIVFPDGTPLAEVLDAWNWSLAALEAVA